MSFFPSDDYKIPSNSNYMKFLDGKNKFRVMSPAIVGFEYWNVESKPIRSRTPFEDTPEDIKRDKDGNARINHFWAFVVWNYEDKRIQILELTQKTVMGAIKAYVDNEAWGDPTGYDLVVTRSGSALNTEYQTIANPHTQVSEDIQKAFDAKIINLDMLYEGKDPFAPEK